MLPPRSLSNYSTPKLFFRFSSLCSPLPSFFHLSAQSSHLSVQTLSQPVSSPFQVILLLESLDGSSCLCPVDSLVSVGVSSISPSAGVKIIFIYHASYGSLLVRCHRVVNKGCRWSPSASLRFLCFGISCTLCSRRRRALCFSIHRTLCLRRRRALCLRLRRALRLAFIPSCVLLKYSET